jgi:secondary thiamine-phosphate synthase enzyme
MVDITGQLSSALGSTGIEEGACCVYVPHTTAGVTINENADPSVKRDIVMELNKLVPLEDGYAHAEGNSAAHMKSSLMGPDLNVPVESGRLMLGTWQSIYFCEFDGPRSRRVVMQLLPAQ